MTFALWKKRVVTILEFTTPSVVLLVNFGKSRCIIFIMYLHTMFIQVYSKNGASRFAKMTYIMHLDFYCVCGHNVYIDA